jgi:hypothetical protein
MWKLFSKKEKKMPPTPENKSSAKLKEMLNRQGDSITAALQRISELSDELSVLKSNLNKFKTDVAHDVKFLTNKVGE